MEDIYEGFLPTLELNTTVTGVVAMVDSHGLLVTPDVLAKSEIFVPADEAGDLAPGDPVELVVTELEDDDGLAHGSITELKRLHQIGEAKRLLADREPIEVVVTGANRGGVLAQFGELRAFVPRRLLDKRTRPKNLKDLVGSSLCGLVAEVEPKGGLIVSPVGLIALERRREGRKAIRAALKTIDVGQTATVRVVNPTFRGCVVVLPNGCQGYIHRDEFDYTQKPPLELVEIGDSFEAVVLGVDRRREWVDLSRKRLLPSPWVGFAREVAAGSTLTGKVVKIIGAGALIRIDGYELVGFAHRKQWDGELVEAQSVWCKLQRIEPEKERASLTMKGLPFAQ